MSKRGFAVFEQALGRHMAGRETSSAAVGDAKSRICGSCADLVDNHSDSAPRRVAARRRNGGSAVGSAGPARTRFELLATPSQCFA